MCVEVFCFFVGSMSERESMSEFGRVDVREGVTPGSRKLGSARGGSGGPNGPSWTDLDGCPINLSINLQIQHCHQSADHTALQHCRQLELPINRSFNTADQSTLQHCHRSTDASTLPSRYRCFNSATHHTDQSADASTLPTVCRSICRSICR